MPLWHDLGAPTIERRPGESRAKAVTGRRKNQQAESRCKRHRRQPDTLHGHADGKQRSVAESPLQAANRKRLGKERKQRLIGEDRSKGKLTGAEPVLK